MKLPAPVMANVLPHFHGEAQGVFVHTINLDAPLICAYTLAHES